ncbi:MAG: 4Fe-4S binding protein [Desulfotignum sp.]|nr:4Fe-4S binding protein [Desulfotignum sp.]MCF8112531.1 4Fe-4S binding protein [Desulfotignum sp.]MCF8124737.1 4Fe-4S binding protein [Desulfotignum sp.]
MENVYKKLARHLDNTPGGFPPTKSGVELRILKQLFTPEQAGLACCLVMMPEPVETIAQRAEKPAEEIVPFLKEMGQKGLILHIRRNDTDTFMLLQFVVGIWEHQVNRLTKQLIKDFNEYVPHLMKAQEKHKTQQLRVVPVEKSVNTQLHIMDHEHLENLVKSQSKILVAPCICRREHTMAGKTCGKMEEACLIFGGGAYIYESRGIGRTITADEAMEIIRKGAAQGLVAQPSNSVKPMNICLCCDCCCQILSNIKKNQAPARIVNSNFQACVDTDQCTGCRACEEICPMDAVTMDQAGIAQVNQQRCIGCGLCVTVCEFEAIFLTDKKDLERWEPPQTLVDTYMKIAKEKGLF